MLRIDCKPTYPENCRIVFVGEALGPDEFLNKEGFTGRAGKLLNKILFASGISRKEIGLTNVVKRAPNCDCGHDITRHDVTGTFECLVPKPKCWCKYYSGFDSEHFKGTFYATTREETTTQKETKRCINCSKTARQHETKKATCKTFVAKVTTKTKLGKKKIRPTDELVAYYELLQAELVSVKPNVVVACGNEALKALCGLDGITKYRGSILPSTLVPGLKVVPLMHPSWILRKQQWQEVYISSRVVRDKVEPQSEYKALLYEPWTEVLMPTLGQVDDYFSSIGNTDYWVIDIETRQFGDISCIGFCARLNNIDTALCVPIQTTKGPYFDQQDMDRFWQRLQALASRNPNLILQNGFFDLAYLTKPPFNFRPSRVHDLMLLFHRMYPELPKKLAFTNMLYTDIPYYKNMTKADDDKRYGGFVRDEVLWKYNCKDTVSTLRIWRSLVNENGKDKEKQTYFSHTQELMPVAFEMQQLGLDVEPEGVNLARRVLLREYGRIRRQLLKMSSGELVAKKGNMKISDNQIAKYLYGTLGLPSKFKRSTGNVTTEEDAIVELMIANPKVGVLKCILAERKFFKVLTSYLAKDIFTQ